jgi:hypothetical protein
MAVPLLLRWLSLSPLLVLGACSDPAPVHALAVPAPGWGAVLWRDGQAHQYGGGPTLVTPRDTSPAVAATGDRDRCGGVALSAPPANAVLAPPSGVTIIAPQKPPTMPAAQVEAAAWRLDEILPEGDGFSPVIGGGDPARQRGLELGSVVKSRRHGAPPVLVVSAVRGCNAALAVLDAKATTTLASVLVPGLCTLPRVLPPADLDGDGAKETALFNEERVVAARLTETAGTVQITVLGDWACPRNPE